jgi:hypothetical protein
MRVMMARDFGEKNYLSCQISNESFKNFHETQPLGQEF